MIIWVIAGLLGLATGLRIGWALVNKQSLVSTAMILALGSLGLVAALNWEPLTLLLDGLMCRYKDLAGGQRQISELHVAGDFADLHSFTLKRLDHNVLALTPCRLAIAPLRPST